jgi:hypothetical protein
MTVLAALIGLIEGDTRVAWLHMNRAYTPKFTVSVPSSQFSRQLHPNVPTSWEPITSNEVKTAFEFEIWKDTSISLDAAHTLWRDRIAESVQAQQLAAGIKVETVGESLGLQ